MFVLNTVLIAIAPHLATVLSLSQLSTMLCVCGGYYLNSTQSTYTQGCVQNSTVVSHNVTSSKAKGSVNPAISSNIITIK
jgi:hypothetical protein